MHSLKKPQKCTSSPLGFWCTREHLFILGFQIVVYTNHCKASHNSLPTNTCSSKKVQLFKQKKPNPATPQQYVPGRNRLLPLNQQITLLLNTVPCYFFFKFTWILCIELNAKIQSVWWSSWGEEIFGAKVSSYELLIVRKCY